MSDIDSTQLLDLINQYLVNSGKDFATLKQVLSNDAISNALGITDKSSQQSVLLMLEQHLDEKFRLYRVGRKIYLGYNKPGTELIMTAIRNQLAPKTISQWAQHLPMSKSVLLESLNQLLDTGQLSVRFNAVSVARIVLGPLASVMVPSIEKALEDDVKSFQAAFDKMRAGKDTVRIHKVREYLNWSIEQFDTTLAKLRAEYRIDLHLGDPSRLSNDEVKNSYIDPHGMLYIGLSWRV